MGSEGYQVNPAAVGSISGDIGGLVSSMTDGISQFGSSLVDGTAFSLIGSPVASANSALQGNLMTGLNQTAQLLTTVNQNVSTAATNYANADTAIAQAYGGNDNATATTTAATQNANAPETAQQLVADPTLRSQLEWAEDPHNPNQLYTAVDDGRGNPTVGHGYNLNQTNARADLTAVGANYDAVRNGTQSLTDDQVNQLFDRDINRAVTAAQNYYSGFDQLDPTRQRVLVDMAFNMGGGGLGQFHQMHQALANGNYSQAADQMQSSAWYSQVIRRSAPLVNEMRTGVPQARTN